VCLLDQFSQNMRTPYYVVELFSYFFTRWWVLTFPSLTSFCHFFGVEGIYHKQKGFVRENMLSDDRLSQLPHLMAPPPACAIKIHWFHLSNNNHPQLEVFHNNLNCQHLGTFCSQDWWWWWWVRWWVGCQVHYVCMISAAVEILQQPNHQVETWDLRQGLMIRSRLERRGLWLVMGLLMRVAAKHDCKKRLVSHTFSVRARGGRGHLSWKSLAN